MPGKYRVMLIDDEESVRKLMRKSISWESLGMEVAGEAGSGIEAINTIDDIRPDIAFVDISMPFMNGIEFTEVATERYPGLVIIIMTAFDDFEYARKCVSLPVFEYMLKPMVRAEVVKVLERVRAKLDASAPASEDDEDDADIPAEDDLNEKIRKYLDENYTDSKINLTEVAQHFGFSPSYLSRKFKQSTGRNFVEYLTMLRMNRAMELAKENEKMFIAASSVGIPDPNYFGRCFKKFTGKSYSDYAAMHKPGK
ncbi:MAG: response regulator [Lachnospiraceae bacterium]|nr:response regulator [Lachnospiraceae bacterium]